MSTETKSTLRKQIVGITREEADLLIKRIDDLAARVEEIEWDVNR